MDTIGTRKVGNSSLTNVSPLAMGLFSALEYKKKSKFVERDWLCLDEATSPFFFTFEMAVNIIVNEEGRVKEDWERMSVLEIETDTKDRKVVSEVLYLEKLAGEDERANNKKSHVAVWKSFGQRRGLRASVA